DRLVHARCGERRIAGVVELRPRVVRHAAVDRDPDPLRQALDAADAIERDPRPPDEGASGLEPDLWLRQARFDECEPRGRGSARREVDGLRHLVGRVVADPETTPEIGDLSRPPELVAAARDEPG